MANIPFSTGTRFGAGPMSGPVRVKKHPNLFQSITGVLVGLLLILGSPIAMWMAGDQHRADDFGRAQSVSADSAASGYVTFRGAPSYADRQAGADCHATGCVYEQERVEALVTKQELECGAVQESATVRILRQDGYEYDEDTGETVPCYQIERDEWQVESTDVSLYDVKVGAFTVTPTEDAVYLETEEDIVNDKFDANKKPIHRSVFTSFVMPSQLLVVGQASGSTVSMPEDRTYVFSAFDAPTTLSKLKELDAQMRLGLWIGAFLMLFIGFSMVFGPLEWAARVFGKLPMIGRVISQGSRGLITLVAGLLAVVCWIIIWICVTLIQVWWLGLLVLALAALGVWMMRRK